MQVALLIIEVMALAADIMTIYLFIETRIEKRSDKKKK